MSDRESLLAGAESTQSLCGDQCFCPHVGPCCCDGSCCIDCQHEEQRRETDDSYGHDEDERWWS